MLKKMMLLLFILSMNTVVGEEYYCQIILNGPKTYPDNLILPAPQNEKECIKEAIALYKKNEPTYNKLFIFTATGIKQVDILKSSLIEDKK